MIPVHIPFGIGMIPPKGGSHGLGWQLTGGHLLGDKLDGRTLKINRTSNDIIA